MDYYPYRFETTIERFGVGKTRKVWYTVVFLPDALREKLPFAQYPRLRIDGEISEVTIANAFIPTGDGRYYLIVSPSVLKQTETQIGDWVRIQFRIADQDYVDIPACLQSAIDTNRDAAKAWETLTPGKKRMLSHHVHSAKTIKTQNKRVNEAIEALTDFKADLRALRRAKTKT